MKLFGRQRRASPATEAGVTAVAVIGAPGEGATARAVFSGLHDEIAARTRETGLVAYAPDLEVALEDLAVMQVRAAAQSALNTDWHMDGAMLRELGRLDAERDGWRDAARKVASELASAESELARLPVSLGWLTRSLLYVGIAGLLGLVVVAVSALLTPALDAFVLRAYVTSLFGQGAATFAVQVAGWLAVAIAAATYAPLGLAVLVTGGRVRATAKLAYIALAEVVLAVAFAAVRAEDGLGPISLGWSAFEFGLAMAFTIGVWVAGDVLGTDSDHRAARRSQEARVGHLAAQLLRLEGEFSKAHERFAEQVRVVGAREEAAEQRDRDEDLARQTARVAYRVTLLAMCDEAGLQTLGSAGDVGNGGEA